MKTPILETKRLILRPLNIDDAETIYKNWTSDPDVARFMRWERHEDVSETCEWLSAEEECVESDEVYNWGFGIATEASEIIIEYGINELKQKQFYCCHAKDNPASGKVMRKVGFVYQKDGEYCSWDNSRRFECKEYILIVE